MRVELKVVERQNEKGEETRTSLKFRSPMDTLGHIILVCIIIIR
jgi:hypothetical protein